MFPARLAVSPRLWYACQPEARTEEQSCHLELRSAAEIAKCPAFLPGLLVTVVTSSRRWSHQVIVNWTDPAVGATISPMSASDAAPLPRLGEVFFDVRGHSRSMRLSWYADTGVAVFSIWQGGRCTGTFRLPIDDLPRMIEILRRGPQDKAPGAGQGRGDGGYPGAERHGESGYGDRPDYDQEPGYPADADYQGDSRYPAETRVQAEPRSGAHRQRGASRTEPGLDEDAGGYATGSYTREGYATQGYPAQPHPGQPPSVPSQPGQDYGQDDDFDAFFEDEDEDGWAGEPRGHGDEPGPDRFVPPYVQPGGPAYRNDSARGAGGYPAGFAGPAYPSDRRADSAPPARYRSDDRFDDDYGDDGDYRLTAPDPANPAGANRGSDGSPRPARAPGQRPDRQPRRPR